MGNWGSKRTAAEPPPPPPKPAPVARVTRAPAQPQINRGYYDDYLTEHQRILERRETLERQRVLLDQYAGNHRPTAAAIHVNHNPPVQNATPEPPTLYQGMLERLTTIEQQRVLLDQYAANRRPTATAIHVDHNPPVQNATPTPDPPTLYQRPAVHSPATPTTPSENVGPSRPISRAPRPPFVPKETPVQSCRFFLRGRCKYGESCNQPHVAPKDGEARLQTRAPPANGPEKTPAQSHCRAWLAGDCPRGRRCRYLHDPEARVAEQARVARLAEDEASRTTKQTILSSTVTFAAGASVLRVVTGIESPLVSVKNLPTSATKAQVVALFTQPGFTRFTVNNLRKCDDGHQEATVAFEDAGAAALAVAGLDGTDFEYETLKLDILTKETGMGARRGEPNVINLTWPAPSMGVVAAYGTMEEARTKAKELDRRSSCGRRIRAAMNRRPANLPEMYFNPASITLSGFPPATDLSVITQFADSPSIKPLKSRNYDLPSAIVQFQAFLTTCGDGLTSFESQTNVTESGMVSAKARYGSWENAKKAHQFLQNKPLHFLSGAKCYASLPDPLCYVKSIPSEQFDAQESMLRALSDGTDAARVRLFPGPPGRNCRVEVSGSDKKAVGTLKVRVEQLVAGEKLEYWDREFLSKKGAVFLRSVLDQTNAHVGFDQRSSSLRVFGEPKAVERAKEMVKEEFERLASLEFSVELKRISVRFFVKQGVGRLAAMVGEENVKLDLTAPPNYKITVRGGGEAVKQTLRTLVDQSFAPSTAAKSKSGETCPVCFDDIDDPLQLVCGHVYCNSCLRHFITTAPDTKSFPLSCMAQTEDHACGSPIPIPTIQRFLLPAQFNRLLEASFQDYLDRHPQEFKYCVTPDCPQIYRIEPGIDLVQCPSCFATTCLTCNEDHEGFSCQEWKLHRDPEAQERLLQAWAEGSGVKKCPRCGVLIEKNGGCNHMECRCGSHICWVCMRMFGAGDIYNHMSSAHNL